MKMLPAEKELIATNDRLVVLTTHRVRVDAKVTGRTRLVSITLDAVASCGVVTRSAPLLLGLGALAALLGATQMRTPNGGSVTLFIVAAVLIAAFFFTRTATLTIASAGGAIEVPASGMSHDSLVSFVDSVEEAKIAFCKRV